MPEILQLERLVFKAGPKIGVDPLDVECLTVTILVGPNNSGKSQALRDIENWCHGKVSAQKVVNEIDIRFPDDPDEAIELIRRFETVAPENQTTAPNNFWIGLPGFDQKQRVIHEQIDTENIRNSVQAVALDQLRHFISRLYTVRLDGRTRFSLSDPKETGDLLQHPRNHLWALFQDDSARERVRALTEEAFGLHFVIDATGLKQFRVRMSSRKPNDSDEEQGLNERSRNFHRNAALITDLSDGVQTFTGLVSAILSLPHRVLLIDEPEAFLHPPLARRLGRNLSLLAHDKDASLVVATHSSDFVMGCVEATPDLQIIRLTYEAPNATARSIDRHDLSELMRDPLLRSAQALRGLFHRCVIVTEGERDRAFYDEINHRLQNFGDGIMDGLFLNAENWQTTSRICTPLRKLGVPAVAITDLDAITNSGSWPNIYRMLNLSGNESSSMEALRVQCQNFLLALPPTVEKKKAYKVIGINALFGIEKRKLARLLKQLAIRGFFVVPVGEIEGWLKYLGVSRDPKKKWLARIFSKMGSDPQMAGYVKPRSSDVWKFINAIETWIEDPNRAGMP